MERVPRLEAVLSVFRRGVIHVGLWVLNHPFINQTPCQYGYIGNVEAFAIGHLRSEVANRPDLTVAQLIMEAKRFASCPMKPNALTVIEGETVREGDVWDLRDLRAALTPPENTGVGKD